MEFFWWKECILDWKKVFFQSVSQNYFCKLAKKSPTQKSQL
jgi:hypothetical protein